MKEKKLVGIIMIQFIIFVVLILLNVFLIMDIDRDNGKKPTRLEVMK